MGKVNSYVMIPYEVEKGEMWPLAILVRPHGEQVGATGERVVRRHNIEGNVMQCLQNSLSSAALLPAIAVGPPVFALRVSVLLNNIAVHRGPAPAAP